MSDPQESDAGRDPDSEAPTDEAGSDDPSGADPTDRDRTDDSPRPDAGVGADHERTVDPDADGNVAADSGEEAAEAAALADEPLGETRRLDGSVRYQWFVGSAIGAVVGAALTGVVFQVVAATTGVVDVDGTLPLGFDRLSVYVGAGALVLYLLLALARTVLYYRSWRYEVRADSLYLTRGVFTRVQTVAPYVRVQHIDTRRSPFERLLGLSSLVVYTAGSRGADVTIPGLTSDRAAELQRRLKVLAIESEEEDAV